MSFIVGGVIIGGAALAGGIGGAIISSNAAKNAADKQAGAAKYAADLQNQQFEETRGDQAPWRLAGTTALGQMENPSFQHDFSATDFQTDPGYQFRLEQGQQAIERSAAASGSLSTGSTLKALTQYNQDFASNEYQNAYNRFTQNQTNRFNRLASLAGLGQTANGQVAQAGEHAADAVGGYMAGAANARGAAGIASANAYGSALTGGVNAGSQAYLLGRVLPQQAPAEYQMSDGVANSLAPYQDIAEE